MFKFLKRPIYLGALRNAINAKLTLSQIDANQKLLIYAYANALYVCGGTITNLDAALEKAQKNIDNVEAAMKRMTDFELNTLYSMAMIECGLEPSLSGESWAPPPRNPFSFKAEIEAVDVSNAISWFKDKHGIAVSIQVH